MAAGTRLAATAARAPVPAVAALVSALVTAICADILRPSVAWLVAGGRDHGELTRAMTAFRDP